MAFCTRLLLKLYSLIVNRTVINIAHRLERRFRSTLRMKYLARDEKMVAERETIEWHSFVANSEPTQITNNFFESRRKLLHFN